MRDIKNGYPVMTKQELSLFPVRFLLAWKKQRARLHGISFSDDNYKNNCYIDISFNEQCGVSKKHGIPYGVYSILIRDFLEVLSSKPHVPNKKESKIIRKLKAKRGN